MAVVEQVSCQDSRTTQYEYYESTIILVFTTADNNSVSQKTPSYVQFLAQTKQSSVSNNQELQKLPFTRFISQ